MADVSYVLHHNPNGKGTRVLIFGSDFTVMEKPEYYFEGENPDSYINTVFRNILHIKKAEPSLLVINSKDWEQNRMDGFDYDKLSKEVCAFEPEIVIYQLGDYINDNKLSYKTIKSELDLLINATGTSGKLIFVTSSNKSPLDIILQEYASDMGVPCVYIGDAFDKYKTRQEAVQKIGGAIFYFINQFIRKI